MINITRHLQKISNFLNWLIAFGLYGWLLLRGGYVFGGNDQIETLSYAKFLQDKTLFTNDFYIQEISKYFFNERFLFSWLVSNFGAKTSVIIFYLHLFVSVALLRGAFALANKFIENIFFSWAAVFLYFIGLQNISLGENNIWYNSLIPSVLAQLFALWAIVFSLQKQLRIAWIFIIITTFFQPLQGVQIFILLVSAYIFQYYYQYKLYLKNIILFFLIWLSTAFIYIFQLTQQYNICTPEKAKLFANILEFRASHHYFPTYFGLKNYIIVLPLLFLGNYFFFLKGRKLFADSVLPLVRVLFVIVTLGLGVYIVGVQIFRSKMILSTQWFATTIWLQFFSVIALVRYIEFSIIQKKYFYKILSNNFLSISIFGISGIIACFLTTPQYRLFSAKNYDLPFNLYQNSTNLNFWEVEIAEQAKAKTVKNAIFVTLTDITYFKYFSERSHFVDYKAIAHNCEAITNWFERINLIYQIDLENRRKKEDLTSLANQHFRNLKEKDFLQLKENQGITHILTDKIHLLNFKIVAENKKFIIYEIF